MNCMQQDKLRLQFLSNLENYFVFFSRAMIICCLLFIVVLITWKCFKVKPLFCDFPINILIIVNDFSRWLESRRQDDNAEGLWRVHDTLYDLTDFINLHPGGADWIKLTKVIFKFKLYSKLWIHSKIHSRALI